MFNFFLEINPIYQSLLAGLFTLFITALGASVVFFFRDINKYVMDAMLSISAGIMLSASFFSLLNPAISLAEELSLKVWLVIFMGFITGGLVLYFGNKFIDFISYTNKPNLSKFKRAIMLFSSITLHNIPEGLVLGVAYGAAAHYNNMQSLLSAITLTVGIAIQNFPEGSAISLPLRRDGVPRMKAFLFGAISAIVEPIAAVIGALLVLKIQSILPFVLSFTAGAMIFVITLELIPESQTNERKDQMALFLMLGFSIMMILELTLG